MEVEVPSRNDRVTFPCHCWLAQDVDGGRTDTGMVTPQSSKPPQPSKLRAIMSLFKIRVDPVNRLKTSARHLSQDMM